MDQLERAEILEEQLEMEYQKRIQNKTCYSCGNCTHSPDEKTDWHWCEVREQFVYAWDIVKDIKCKCYDEQ